MFWLLLCLFVVILVYWKVVKPHSYWTERGVKQGAQVFLLGDTWGTTLKKHSISDVVQNVYQKFPKERYSGMYQFLYPVLVIRDPDLIRQITVKDFDHFTDHIGLQIDGENDDIWFKNLFQLKGQKWRDMRATLSPAFTTSKMKAMFTLMASCAEQFTNHFLKNGDCVVELKDSFTRYTNDVIATCAFGVECDSLEDRENTFYMMGKQVTNFSGFWKNLKFIFMLLLPRMGKRFGLKLFSKDVEDFFTNLVTQTVQMREAKNIVRPDMIHLMMEARKGRLQQEDSSGGDSEFAAVDEATTFARTKKANITMDDMIAQALLFFFGGFESVSTLMCFMSYELAVHPEVQKRLVEEVDEVMRQCNGKLTYDLMMKMKYLDMVTSETLRKWPPAAAVDRVCVSPYTIKPENPNEAPLTIKKDEMIWIPIWGLHYDPSYYPEPEKFDPERFSDENKADIKPYTYLPFGVGPRNCIASRFALMEAKTVMVYLLSKFELVVDEKTQVPLKLSKSGFTLNAENGIWVGLKARK